MTLCPYALVLSCQKCPIVKVCPLKGVIGDAKPKADAQDGEKGNGAKGPD